MKDDLKKKLPKFFIKLFREHEDIRSFFKLFEGMSLEEIEKSSKLRAHATNFRMGVASYVENLDIEDLSTVVVLIQKTAENHFVRRQIRGKEFRVALKCFLEFLQESMKVDEAALTSWEKTFNVVASVIDDHVKTLEQTENK